MLEKSTMTMRTLFLGRPSDVSVQFLRYTFVGGLAFGFDFGVLFSLTDLVGLHYLLSAAIAFGVGLTVNYTLSTAWVFPRRKTMPGAVHFAIFGLIGIVGLALNELVMWTLTEHVHVHYLGSKVCSTVIVYLWNFSIRKYVLYT